MGNCGSRTSVLQTCRAIFDHEKLEADPDIVGLGVLASFFITAFLTLGAIIVGYVTQSLPRRYYNGVDTVLLVWLRTNRVSRSLLPYRPYWRNFVNQFHKHHIFPSMSEEERIEAFTKFILTLSDQQLVTGMAILIAALSNHCRVSMFELNVVVSLSWFSAATHLATLDVLQDYFRSNPLVRTIRVVGMLIVLALLVAGIIITMLYSGALLRFPIHCGPAVNGYTFADMNGTTIFTTIITLGYLAYAYPTRIYLLYRDHPLLVSHQRHLAVKKSKTEDMLPNISSPEREQLVENMIENYYLDFTRSARTAQSHSVIRHLWWPFYLCGSFYGRSFLGVLGSLCFAFAYGIAQVKVNRFNVPVVLEESIDRMDFAQIVPLVLLALPFLAFLEIVYEQPAKAGERLKRHPERTKNQTDANSEDDPCLATHEYSSALMPFPGNPEEDPLQGILNRRLSVILLEFAAHALLGISTAILLNVNNVGAYYLLIMCGYYVIAHPLSLAFDALHLRHYLNRYLKEAKMSAGDMQETAKCNNIKDFHNSIVDSNRQGAHDPAENITSSDTEKSHPFRSTNNMYHTDPSPMCSATQPKHQHTNKDALSFHGSITAPGQSWNPIIDPHNLPKITWGLRRHHRQTKAELAAVLEPGRISRPWLRRQSRMYDVDVDNDDHRGKTSHQSMGEDREKRGEVRAGDEVRAM